MGETVLILAHPGHELLLHHWMERTRPRVYLLTDGSGGAKSSRVHFSAACVERAGATAGGVFGEASDKSWYRALADRDAAPFADVAERIVRDLATRASLVVCDPVEGFNPMHDMAAAVAAYVCARTGSQLATYPLVHRAGDEPAIETLTLGSEALQRKREAIAAYTELAGETDSFAVHDQASWAVEHLFAAPPLLEWFDQLPEHPDYERIGAERVASGRYQSALTSAGHVRPVVEALLGLVAHRAPDRAAS
ncbi:MAG: hypothetical protein AB7H66_01025 [Hyphomonadaceae bacterium]